MQGMGDPALPSRTPNDLTRLVIVVTALSSWHFEPIDAGLVCHATAGIALNHH